MKISKEDVIYIARLAKLRLSEEEAERMTEEFGSILAHFQSIDMLGLEGVNADEISDGRQSVVRPDKTSCFGDRQKLFANVKSMRGTYIQVPKIIE